MKGTGHPPRVFLLFTMGEKASSESKLGALKARRSALRDGFGLLKGRRNIWYDGNGLHPTAKRMHAFAYKCDTFLS